MVVGMVVGTEVWREADLRWRTETEGGNALRRFCREEGE